MEKISCFSINTIIQFEELITSNKIKQKKLVIFINNSLIKGFGVSWLKSFIYIIQKNNFDINIKFFVDAGSDYGLSILLMNEKVDFIKLRSSNLILKKIKNIATKNKVLLNPDFNIVDLTKKIRKNNL